jgi:tetratricopeptide (TPR) repeat protein
VLSSSGLFAKETPFLQEVVYGGKLDVWKKEHRVEHSDLIVNTLLLSAEEALERGDLPAAVLEAKKAAAFSPKSPLPHYFLSDIAGFKTQDEILQTLDEYAAALRLSFNHFLFLSTSIGIFGIALFIAICASIITFLLYVFILYFPQWIHYFQERFTGRLYPVTMGLIIAIIPVLLFFLLPPFWFLLISLFLLWFFYKPAEKKAAIALMMGLVFSSLLLIPSFTLLTAQRSELLGQMVKNQQGEFLWSAPSFATTKTDWKASFLLAAHHANKKDFTRAERLYKEALLRNPDSALILNNLGNIAFYRDDFEKAMDYYQKAIAIAPNDVAAHYNISQVHNERLAFKEGEEKYKETKQMNPEKAKYYAQLVSEYPNYPVVDGRFTALDIWKEVLRLIRESGNSDVDQIWQAWVGDFSAIEFMSLSFFLSMGLVSVSIYFSQSISGSICSVCFKATCERCQKTFSNHIVCEECGADVKASIAKKSGTLPKRVYPLFLFPGGGQMVLQRPVLTFSLMVPFYFILTLMLAGDRFLTTAHGHLSIEKSVPFLTMALFLYGFSLFDLYWRRRRS